MNCKDVSEMIFPPHRWHLGIGLSVNSSTFKFMQSKTHFCASVTL